GDFQGAKAQRGGAHGVDSKDVDAQEADPLSGTLEIKGGAVIVRPPRMGEQPPVIAPGRHVKVIVNGVEITKPTPVKDGDSVTLELEERSASIEYQLEISADEMEAFLSIRKERGMTLQLADAPPQRFLKPLAIIKERPEPAIPTIEAVTAQLAQQGVTFGLDTETLAKLVSGELKGRQRIALGVPAQKGSDAYVDFLYADAPRRPVLDE